MQRTFRGLALAAVFALSVPWLHADHPTTITLQSGERLSGRFADLHNDLVYLRVSQHEEPRIPLRDIARIEFTEARAATPSGTRDSVRGEGPHRLVLRNGREIAGRFEGLTGDDQPHTAGHPLEFVFSTASGEYVRVNADRIARIELAPLPESPGTATGNVTIRLDDGTSMRGDLRSLDANGLAMGDRVNGGDRRYGLDQVAVIDFGGSTAAAADRGWSPRGEREPHLLVMRNGREISGEFLGGTRGGRERDRQAYLFRSAGNGRIVTFTPATASRLYLGGSVSNGGFGFGDERAGGVEVLAQRQWISTGLQVRRGETLQFTAHGEVQLSDGRRRSRITSWRLQWARRLGSARAQRAGRSAHRTRRQHGVPHRRGLAPGANAGGRRALPWCERQSHARQPWLVHGHRESSTRGFVSKAGRRDIRSHSSR